MYVRVGLCLVITCNLRRFGTIVQVHDGVCVLVQFVDLRINSSSFTAKRIIETMLCSWICGGSPIRFFDICQRLL